MKGEKAMNSKELYAYLNDYLEINSITDYRGAFNGLQTEGGSEVVKVAVAVDACIATFEQAVSARANLLIVHHGLFWGVKAPITGAYYRRLSLLLRNDLALYSCHLPLDVHLEVGNNHVLAKMLDLEATGTFYEFEGTPIGISAYTRHTRGGFVELVRSALGVEPKVLATGPKDVRKVGIMTGGGGSAIGAAARAGVDTLLTGEGNHHTYFEAEELGINVIYAGHYATETLGVRALAKHLEVRFGLETLFIDHPTEL